MAATKYSFTTYIRNSGNMKELMHIRSVFGSVNASLVPARVEFLSGFVYAVHQNYSNKHGNFSKVYTTLSSPTTWIGNVMIRGPSLPTWNSFNSITDKYSRAQLSVGWNYLFIPKLQWSHRWRLRRDKLFHLTFCDGRNYSSLLRLKLNRASKRGHSTPLLDVTLLLM